MVRMTALMALILIAGCKQQSFDERYKSAQHKLEATAAKMDKDLSAAQSDAAEAGVIPSDAALPDLPTEPSESAKPR